MGSALRVGTLRVLPGDGQRHAAGACAGRVCAGPPASVLAAAAELRFAARSEVAMWAEQADASDLDRAIWPRAAAIGERLWTPLARLNVSAQERLGHFRCLLNARGIGASEMGQTTATTDPKTGEKQPQPAAFSGIPPGPGSCLQGAANRTSPAAR